jgi:hypothetical protein
VKEIALVLAQNIGQSGAIRFLPSNPWRSTVTLSLAGFVRHFASALSRSSGIRRHPWLDPNALSRRDLDDLNLPEHILAEFRLRSEYENTMRKISR